MLLAYFLWDFLQWEVIKLHQRGFGLEKKSPSSFDQAQSPP
jgi:hypothetical protein